MAASSNLPWKPTTSFGATRRAYTISRFKGPSYSYGESAYHLPITLYKLLSGVTFVNIQTAPDDRSMKESRLKKKEFMPVAIYCKPPPCWKPSNAESMMQL